MKKGSGITQICHSPSLFDKSSICIIQLLSKIKFRSKQIKSLIHDDTKHLYSETVIVYLINKMLLLVVNAGYKGSEIVEKCSVSFFVLQ